MKKAQAQAKYLWHCCISNPASVIRDTVAFLFWGAIDTINAFLPQFTTFWWVLLIPIGLGIAFFFPDIFVLFLKLSWALFAWIWNQPFKSFVDVMRTNFKDIPGIVNTTSEIVNLFIADFFDRAEGWLNIMWTLLLTTFDFFVASLQFYMELIIVTIDQIFAGARDFMCDAGFLDAASCADVPSFYTPITEYVVGNTLLEVYKVFDAFWLVADFVIQIMLPFVLMSLMAFGAFVAMTVQMFAVFLTFGTELFLNLLLYLLGLIWGNKDYHGEIPTNSTSRPFQEYIKDKYQNFDMSPILNIDPVQMINNTRLDYVPGMPAYRTTLINLLYEIRNIEKWINENFAQTLAFGDHKLCCALNLNTCGRYLYICDLIFAKDGPLWYALLEVINMPDIAVLNINIFYEIVKTLMQNVGVSSQYLATHNDALEVFMAYLMANCKILGGGAGNCICNSYVASRSRPEDAPLFTWGKAGQTTNFPDAFGSFTAIERVPCWLPGGFCLVADPNIVIWENSQCVFIQGSTYTSIQAPFLGVFMNLTTILGQKPSHCTFWGSLLQVTEDVSSKQQSFYDADRDSWPWNNTFPMMVYDLYAYRYQKFHTRDELSDMANTWIGPDLFIDLVQGSTTLDSKNHYAVAGSWGLIGGYGETSGNTIPPSENLGTRMQNRLMRNWAFRAYGDDSNIYWSDWDVMGTKGLEYQDELTSKPSFFYSGSIKPNDARLTNSLLTGICFAPYNSMIMWEDGLPRDESTFVFSNSFFIRNDLTGDSCNIRTAQYAPVQQVPCNPHSSYLSSVLKQNPTAVCPISKRFFNTITNEEAMCLISGTWINEARNVFLRTRFTQALQLIVQWSASPEYEWALDWIPDLTQVNPATISQPPFLTMTDAQYVQVIDAMYDYQTNLVYTTYDRILSLCDSNPLLRGTSNSVDNCKRVWTKFQLNFLLFSKTLMKRFICANYYNLAGLFCDVFQQPTAAQWAEVLKGFLTSMLQSWNRVFLPIINDPFIGYGPLLSTDYDDWFLTGKLTEPARPAQPQWLSADPRMIYDHLVNNKISQLCALGIKGKTSSDGCEVIWTDVALNLPSIDRIYSCHDSSINYWNSQHPTEQKEQWCMLNSGFFRQSFADWWFPASLLKIRPSPLFGYRYNMAQSLFNQYRWAQSAYKKQIPLNFLNPIASTSASSTEDPFTAIILNYMAYAVMRRYEDDSSWLVGHPIFSSTDELTYGFLMSENSLPTEDYQFSRNFPCKPTLTNSNPFFNYTMELTPHLQVIETVRYYIMKEMLKKFWARIYPANCQLVQSFIVDCDSSKFWMASNWEDLANPKESIVDLLYPSGFRPIWQYRTSLNNEKYDVPVKKVPLAELVTRQLVKEYTGDGSAAGSFRYAANRVATYAGNTTAEYVAATMSILNTTKTLFDSYANVTWASDVNVPAGTPAANAQALCIARFQPRHLCVSYTTPEMMIRMANPLRYSEKDVMKAWFDTNYNFGNGPMVRSKIDVF